MLCLLCPSWLPLLPRPDIICGSSAEYRKTQLTRLAELVKKRAEIETNIAEDVQELNGVYETLGEEMREELREKVSTFG